MYWCETPTFSVSHIIFWSFLWRYSYDHKNKFMLRKFHILALQNIKCFGFRCLHRPGPGALSLNPLGHTPISPRRFALHAHYEVFPTAMLWWLWWLWCRYFFPNIFTNRPHRDIRDQSNCPHSSTRSILVSVSFSTCLMFVLWSSRRLTVSITITSLFAIVWKKHPVQLYLLERFHRHGKISPLI
jgi:hypothetical protein